MAVNDALVLLIVSHPDDETLGCCHQLLRHPARCHVLHTTTGAPAEARFWQQAGVNTREEYAAARRTELLAAMAVFGLHPEQMHNLPFGDRDLIHNLLELVGAVHRLLLQLRPRVLYTHAFEGGHPDHDSTRYAVERAVKRLRDTSQLNPEVREFAGYHARDGDFFGGDFLAPKPTDIVDNLSSEECSRKREALNGYRSQQRVIQRFALSPERWRCAQETNFATRPHDGPLYYEIRQMGCRFEDFAARVAEADAVLLG